MGIAIINKLYNVQAEAKAIPLGEKRKRGRPSYSHGVGLFHLMLGLFPFKIGIDMFKNWSIHDWVVLNK